MSTPYEDPPPSRQPLSAEERMGWPGSLLDLHPFPALLVEADGGRPVFANEAARRLGLNAAAADAGSVLEVAGEPIELADLLPQLLARGAGAEGVEVVWSAADRSLSFRVFSRKMPSPDGQAALALLSFLDVTGQRAAEEELRAAVEARDEFFSVATHELKDPLFALQLSIQLLDRAARREGDVPEFVRRHLEVSRRQIDRLSRLVDNLLDVSRITGRRLQLDLETFDLSDLTREVIGRMGEKAQAAGTTVEAEVAEPVLGYFDRLKVEQILVNLLTNAIKYGAGRPVTVRACGQGDWAVLEVEDRGVGIAAADRERIFRRFERASSGHRKESLGLGLYIVRSLVEAHGGTVSVCSEPGRGSTFTVTLPRNRLQQPGPAGEEASESTGE